MATFTGNSTQQDIKQVLQKEIECTHMLSQSLDMEYAALADRNADILDDAVRDKQEKIQQLELISRQRERLLTAFNHASTDKNNVHNKQYHFNGNEQLIDLWSDLVDVAEKCREKNRVNGSIIELVTKQSRHALDILHGILPGASPTSELYDNAGLTTKSANKRSLVQV